MPERYIHPRAISIRPGSKAFRCRPSSVTPSSSPEVSQESPSSHRSADRHRAETLAILNELPSIQEALGAFARSLATPEILQTLSFSVETKKKEDRGEEERSIRRMTRKNDVKPDLDVAIRVVSEEKSQTAEIGIGVGGNSSWNPGTGSPVEDHEAQEKSQDVGVRVDTASEAATTGERFKDPQASTFEPAEAHETEEASSLSAVSGKGGNDWDVYNGYEADNDSSWQSTPSAESDDDARSAVSLPDHYQAAATLGKRSWVEDCEESSVPPMKRRFSIRLDITL